MYDANLDFTGLRIVPLLWNKAGTTAASSCENALANNLWYYNRSCLFFPIHIDPYDIRSTLPPNIQFIILESEWIQDN